MICFMYPGQPLRLPTALPDDELFRDISTLTRERTGLDLGSLSWRGQPGSDNVRLQVLGVAMSLYHTRRLAVSGTTPSCIAEHSMGIYPALAAAGAISPGDALEMAYRVGMLMSGFAAPRAFALGCIVGLTLEPLLAIAEKTGVFLANHNTSRHFLLSGERRFMEEAEAEALQRGAFSVKLFPCDAPLHTPLMSEIMQDLRDIFAGFAYRTPQVPLVNHIDQDCLVAQEIPEFLVRELMSPVYWERSWHALRSMGVTQAVEVGMGDSLKKYNRWIDSESGR